jgi:hypothetical protein
VTITNDGATILAKMHVVQPAARMFVELSKSQDVVAGDGTTSVTVLAGSILGKCMTLVAKGVHPTVISDALGRCADKAVEVLRGMAEPVELGDREALTRAASTSLNSKVVSQYSSLLAPIAVDCVLRVLDPARPDHVGLRDVKIVKRLGGTVDDTEVVEGLVFDHKASKAAGGPTRVENAKIALIQVRAGAAAVRCSERHDAHWSTLGRRRVAACASVAAACAPRRGCAAFAARHDQAAEVSLAAPRAPPRMRPCALRLMRASTTALPVCASLPIHARGVQFCVSPPKTDIENSVVVSDYAQMDRILKDERCASRCAAVPNAAPLVATVQGGCSNPNRAKEHA